MNLELIFLLIVVSNYAITLLILVLIYQSTRRFKDLNSYLGEFEQIKELAAKEAKENINKLVVEIEETLKISQQAKGELEEKVNLAIDQMISKYTESIDSVTKSVAEKYQQKIESTLGQIDQKLDQQISASVTQISNSAKSEIANLAKFVAEKEVEVEKEVDTQVEKETIDAQSDVDNYKKAKIAQIDAQITKILTDVARQSLGRAIDLSSHEEIVMQALDKAKKDNLI